MSEQIIKWINTGWWQNKMKFGLVDLARAYSLTAWIKNTQCIQTTGPQNIRYAEIQFFKCTRDEIRICLLCCCCYCSMYLCLYIFKRKNFTLLVARRMNVCAFYKCMNIYIIYTRCKYKRSRLQAPVTQMHRLPAQWTGEQKREFLITNKNKTNIEFKLHTSLSRI